jgi:site-specific recombinase XerD
VSLVYRLGIQNGKVKENPARLVKHRQENNACARWLSDEEEVRLRAYLEAASPQFIPELDLALHTGMRLGEVYSLTWDGVNLSRKTLTIPRSKNGEMRHIPLNSAAISALEAFRKRGDSTGNVIRNSDGETLAGPRYWFEPTLKKAKIYRLSWHCLRHTFASRLVMRGVDIRTAQELMGHKSISMTVRYSHLAPRHTLAAVELLAEGTTAASTDTKTSTEGAEQIQAQVATTY